jgi:hypothetical protein
LGQLRELQSTVQVSEPPTDPNHESFYWNGSIHPLTAYWIPHMMEWAGVQSAGGVNQTHALKTDDQGESKVDGKIGRDFVDRRGRGRPIVYWWRVADSVWIGIFETLSELREKIAPLRAAQRVRVKW